MAPDRGSYKRKVIFQVASFPALEARVHNFLAEHLAVAEARNRLVSARSCVLTLQLPLGFAAARNGVHLSYGLAATPI